MWDESGITNTGEDDTDMGNWNDKTQENNSSWSSASGWKPGIRKGGAIKVSS